MNDDIGVREASLPRNDADNVECSERCGNTQRNPGGAASVIDVMLLGTGAMVPLPDRYLSSVLFRLGGSLNLVDCGEGTQMSWRRFHWGFKRLDAIFLTHHHADHVAGLPGLFHTVANAGRTAPMHIYGPSGTIAVIKGLRVIAPWLPYDMMVQELTGGETLTLPSGLEVRVALGEHRGPVLGYRFTLPRKRGFLPERAGALGVPRTMWGALQRGERVSVGERMISADDVLGPERKGVSFATVTDSRPTDAMRELANRIDLLICEGTYGDDADTPKAIENGHMTFREAATLARDANAGALWLTHFGAGMPRPEEWARNARDVFPHTVIGEAGLVAQLTFDAGYRGGVDSTSVSPESTDSM
jgi:ribonuclease Z